MIERTIVRWILALLFLAITTYPSSPFFYQFLVGNPVYAYLVILFVFFICSILLKNKAISISPKARINTFSILQALVGVSLLLTFMTTKNPTAVRDLLTYLVLWIFIFLVRDGAFIKVLRTKYLLASVLIAISIIAYVLLLFSPEIRLDWFVSDLALDNENPVVKRNTYGDFAYSMLFYHSVILYDSGTKNLLFSSIFSEPTYTFVFLLGPLFFYVRNDNFFGRLFIIVTIASFLLFTLTVFATLTIIVGTLVGLVLLYINPSLMTVKISVVLISVCFWLLGGTLFSEIVELLPRDKSSQLNYYFGPEQIAALASEGTFFGLANVPEGPSWGSSIVIFRYGYFGFLVYVSLIIFYLVEASKFLLHRELSKTKRFFSFMALFSATLMSVKTPNMLLITSLLIYVALGYLNKLKDSSGELPT